MLLAPPDGVGCALSTRYHRWDAKGGERAALFGCLQYVAPIGFCRRHGGPIPKVGADTGARLLNKMLSDHRLSESVVARPGHKVFWVRVPGYFCQFFLRAPQAFPEEEGPPRTRGEVLSVAFGSDDDRRIAHALLNSSIYFHFHVVCSDGRHINPSDVKGFPFHLASLDFPVRDQLVRLSGELDEAMKANTSFRRKSGLRIESVDSSALKPILDQVDRVLAPHYGFTDEELDFIINYDYKYRMGGPDSHGDGESEDGPK